MLPRRYVLCILMFFALRIVFFHTMANVTFAMPVEALSPSIANNFSLAQQTRS